MQNTEKKSSVRFWLIVASIIFCIIIASAVGAISFIQRPIEIIASPVIHVTRNIFSWIADIPQPLKKKIVLLTEIKKLEDQNVKLQEENSRLKSISKEIDIEIKLSEFLKRINSDGISAHVIGKSTLTQQVLLLDKGKDQGVQVGYPVIAHDGILIGTVASASPNTSRVLLVTDISQNIAAKVQNEKSSPGIVRGTYGLSLLLDLIPQGDVLSEGQSVVTSSVNPKIPPNVLIGTISKIRKEDGNIFQQAQLSVPIPLDRIEIVSIIIPQNVNP